MFSQEKELLSREELREEYNAALQAYEEESGETIRPEEREVAELVMDILYETELPVEGFGVVKITSTLNEHVVPKLNQLLRVPELVGMLWPAALNNDNLDTSEEAILAEPWPNNVHVWMAILNECNTIRNIQRGIVPLTGGEIFATTHDLFLKTTLARKLLHLRSDLHIAKGEEFPETTRRRNGTQGKNPGRYVTLGELKKQLDAMKLAYEKGRFSAGAGGV